MSYTTMTMFPELDIKRPPAPAGTKIIVSLSGGKDSAACLLDTLENYDIAQVIAHHQIILEDWPETIEYNQQLCKQLGVPYYQAQASYHGYACCRCQYHYLTSRNVQICPKCQGREGRFLRMVKSVLDLVEWREMWPSLSVRFCTSYFKRDNFNMWARENKGLLGKSPVVVLGERWRESRGRAKLPYIRQRSNLEYMTEWRPILDYRRIDVFRKLQEHGIEPHYCYVAQGMTEHEMYEVDEEGGPRMSCVMCFLKSPEQMKASYQTEQGRDIIERGLEIERRTGHTIQNDRSLESMVQ
jgi:3'-phosphoadenosine 5'-phosphosulfate sulfotransferase (PAPS reductase)/FAD synthetase